MSRRTTTILPYAIAAVLPLAGLILAAAWAVEKRRSDAALVAGASLLGALIWLVVLSA